MSTSTPERILQRLDWHVVRRLDGVLQGNYRTLFYGFGLDLPIKVLRGYLQARDDVIFVGFRAFPSIARWIFVRMRNLASYSARRSSDCADRMAAKSRSTPSPSVLFMSASGARRENIGGQ